jgi:DNA-binding IclR family transcriptional regulator
MRRDPFAIEMPRLQDVLDALDDPDCRTIIKHVDEPMTASELSEACDIPLSTTYRKLELLSEASLLEERIRIRTDGRHTTVYELGFEEVRIGIDEDRSIDVAIRRRDRTPDRRLSDLWSEVRKET